MKHKTWDKIFFILIPTTIATLWPFSLLCTCFSSFKLDSTPTLLFRFISLTIFPFVLVFLKLVFFNLNFGSCFLSKIGIFVYSYWRSTVGRKKGNSLLVLPVGLFLIIFQMFQIFFFLAHCFMFFDQMTIIYLSLESCWYIRPHTRISLCILGYICIFMSNLFLYYVIESQFLKIIWLIILKTLSLLMWLNTYIYIFLSTLFFLEMYESITHSLIYLNFFISDISFSFTLFYIVCVGDFWLRFWCMYITFLWLLS